MSLCRAHGKTQIRTTGVYIVKNMMLRNNSQTVSHRLAHSIPYAHGSRHRPEAMIENT